MTMLEAKALRWIAALACATLPGCLGDGSAPRMEAVADQVAVVGQELVINLRATDPDGDTLTFDFSAPIEGVDDAATITRRPDGTAVFRWTPLADHLGTWFFDFSVSDDDGADTVTVVVDVRATGGDGSAPIFREPLGSGTTLDLERDSCLQVPIVIEDQDSTEVTLGQDPPIIEGAEILQDGPLSGVWTWCPSPAQASEDRHSLVLTADDGTTKAVKNYLIVLRQTGKADCPGEPPQIIHSPRDWDKVLDIEIVADITDDVGLKHAPLLYYTDVEPKTPLDFGSFDVKEMELLEGDAASGRWRATIPNPVATAATGTSAPIWYIVSASDDDDATGDCDHLVDAPQDGAFVITVTNGGGAGAGVCEPCSADTQCGGADDLCATLGASGETVCGAACETSEACDAGFGCITVTSVDGTSARQCVPQSGTCDDEPPPPVCEDDSAEDNDSLAQAMAKPALGVGNHAMMACPAGSGDDEDWFRIVIAQDTTITASIAGTNATDLDFQLVTATGAVMGAATGPTSNETIQTCLGSGTYYLRVFTSDVGANPYTLSYATSVGSCGPSCQDDSHEPDDTFATATYAEVWPDGYAVQNRMICSGDDDYYRVELYTGETIVVDLTFSQGNAQQDLDLHFFSPSQVDLTPCSEASPGTCSAAQGQSVTSNEHYEHTVSQAGCAPCNFWVMVHGWNGSQNSYGLALSLQ